jgi:hypothetical protein
LGQSPTIPTAAILAATATTVIAAVVVQPCSYTITTIGYHQATNAVSHQQLSMLQL